MVPSILIVEDDLTFSTMLKTWLGKKDLKWKLRAHRQKHASNSAHVAST